MPIALRQAEVVWDGTLAGGAGALSSGSGALDLPVTDKEELGRNVAKAADLCPVSNALRGNVEITVHDEVDDG